jgi:2'-5' RNA ligase
MVSFVQALRDAVADEAPVSVSLTHLERFTHHPTMYYAVERSESLQRLHENVLSVVKEHRERDYTGYYRKAQGRAGLLLRVYGSEYVLERFLPHLSLTRHDGNKEKFALLWNEEPTAPPEAFSVNKLTLLRLEPDGTWSECETIPFDSSLKRS